jgi:hypothetical protein
MGLAIAAEIPLFKSASLRVYHVVAPSSDREKRMSMGRLEEHQQFLQMALIGFASEKARIDSAIAALKAKLGEYGQGPMVDSEVSTTAPRQRIVGAATRKRIAAAQRKRWTAGSKTSDKAASRGGD